MPYWIVHGNLLVYNKYLFLGSPQFRVKSLCHFPWSKQPLDAVGTRRGQHETRCQRRHLENLHGAKMPRNSTQLFQLGKRTQKSGQNRVKNGVQNSGKGKTTSAVVSECALRFWNPGVLATLKTHYPYHPPRYSLATSWLSRRNSPYFPQWFWCSV